MLKLRVLTVVVLLPLFVAGAFWLPVLWWACALFAITLIAATEWARLAGFGTGAKATFYGLIASSCALIWLAGNLDEWVFGISVVCWTAFAPFALAHKLTMRGSIKLILAGVVALVPMWLALVRLQPQPAMLLALLAVIWISDSAAYGAGHAIGRHKLAPAISPGKTWEGVAGAFVAVAVYALIFHFWWFPATDLALVLMAFFGLTTLGILGDLLESLLKRNAGAKDSGTLLPGHGGVLDRIDALTAAMPLAAWLFVRTS